MNDGLAKMPRVAQQKEFVTFSPELRADDELANYWLRQVTLRLRRELCWRWHECGLQPKDDTSTLPPFADKATTSLDLTRFWEHKQRFFSSDVTARYLNEQIGMKPPLIAANDNRRGSFAWVAGQLRLDAAAMFLLALALAPAFDASSGSVIAACLNDPAKTLPTLSLVQKLWDRPQEALLLADPFHPLFRSGLIKAGEQANASHSQTNWDTAITMTAIVANQLLFPETRWPHGLEVLDNENGDREFTESEGLLSLRLSDEKNESLRIVPVIGSRWSAYREVVKMIARSAGRTVVETQGQAVTSDSQDYLNSIATLCWLRGADLFMPLSSVSCSGLEQQHSPYPMASSSIPATVFLALDDRKQLSSLPQKSLLPLVSVRPLSYQERVAEWTLALGAKSKGLKTCIAEISRRFRYEQELIRQIAGSLKSTSGKISEKALVEACRAALDVDVGELAVRVIPRFENETVILPPKQEQQFAEQVKAMRSLTEVHYVWGTAKAMNESGIAVLFAGPPGTGKTMAAEVLAIKLDLPMYRIDLSQVVNKYIGETEKNLKRVFDAADISDMILFFDEADSLFGRRTEVSDAHDRYANLEISYLLERMERFKGLAILATNRKKDLDEAFLRRLRYIIDFPVPGIEQRRRIWQQVIPPNADSSELDFDFLAKQFPLAGGNIRSIVFNACLQAAADRSPQSKRRRVLTMKSVLVAIRREHDKMNRSLSVGQLGDYASLLEGIEI
jgi:hypothetical protein